MPEIDKMRLRRWGCWLLGWLCLTGAGLADAQQYKQLPPAGIEVDPALRSSLRQQADRIQQSIDSLAARSDDAAHWKPDVEVLVRAVRLALEQNLFYKEREIQQAGQLLDEASSRIAAVKQGKRGLALMGWSPERSGQTQLLVGGFVSRIDDSVQPFGLVVPAGYDGSKDIAFRLDVWLHGRGDTKTEIPFLIERMTRRGQYAPADTFVLHPFGRHCNAFKFAGETDVYEALAHVRELVKIDQRRIAVRGFSMGGAGCWHLAVHNPGLWFAANPGAGFVDTIGYQNWDTKGFPYPIDATRRQLMSWYDVLPWVNNLRNTKVIAYSGENDKQKKAADRVHAASMNNGFQWPYVIGAGMGHKIDPASAQQIDEQLEDFANQLPAVPRREIDFTTLTLRYHQVGWLQVTGLKQHFRPGRVQARLVGDRDIEMTTSGVTRLKLDFRDSGWPRKPVNGRLTIDGQTITVEDWNEAPGIQCELMLDSTTWKVVEVIDNSLRKR
ncbi:MAG: prolyl oligopeptidase family serine peptidase, partial [Pirellulales bacterium]|nr:prolyl oligopeptidase family serine peptidase [Pirellulales bacterium]